MIHLQENKGIPSHIIFMMAIISGLTVANLYYNQPLLEVMRASLHINEVQANLITVITQIGYAAGLCFIIPMGDLYSRRRLIIINMATATVMTVLIAISQSVWVVWPASLVLGACSVIPQFFMPIIGQFSKPENKSRNMGFVLSGLLTGILASRVLGGFIGDWLGWRAMFFIAALLMVLCMITTLRMMPDAASNFKGSYLQLMHSVAHIFLSYPRIRLNAARAAFGFGSMLCIWSCLAFHLAQPPFNAGSDMVGVLGLCGIAGATAASGIGKFIPRFGVKRFSMAGALLQLLAWAIAYTFGNTYVGLIAAIIIVDVGVQCLQLSNQSQCIQEVPHAASRSNTIFMTSFFIGGSIGTFCGGQGWNAYGWAGVCLVGAAFAIVSFLISLFDKRQAPTELNA